MNPSERRKFGRKDFSVTAFAFGTAPLGNFLQEVGEQEADDMIQQAWNAGIRLYDTSPMYGHGLAELRLGHSLRWKKEMTSSSQQKSGERYIPPAGLRLTLPRGSMRPLTK